MGDLRSAMRATDSGHLIGTTGKKPFTFHVAETRHFEFEVWATDEEAARDFGRKIWREAATTGQWELAQEETDYSVTAAVGQAGGRSDG